MTKEEQDKIREELNKAFAANEKKKAEKASEEKAEEPAPEKKEKKAPKKKAEPKKTSAAEKKPKAKKPAEKKADKSAPEKKAEKAEKPAAKKKEQKPKERKAPEKKPEESVPKTKEEIAAAAILNAPASAPESVRVGRASRSKEKGSKHEKAEPKKKEKKKEQKKAEPSPAKREKKKEKKAEKPAPEKKEEAGQETEETAAPESTRAGRAESRSREAGSRHGSEPEKMGCLKWFLLALLLMLVVGAAAFGFFRYRSMLHSYNTAYIASTTKDAALYTLEKDEDADGDAAGSVKAVETERLVRGTPVKRYADKVTIDDVTYCRVDKTLLGASEGTDIIDDSDDASDAKYVREENLADSPDDIVLEKEVYVRTPATIYSEETGPAIESFAPKGSCLEVTGFDKINPDGSINKYQVKYTNDKGDSVKGYVYGKYMVDTQEKADAIYNENGIADKVSKDNYGYDLYGGKAANLDYYPYERTEIKGNEFCEDARAMYINCAAAVNYKPWVSLIKETDCNAVVIDIKDGVLAYKSEVAKELSPSSYDTAYVSMDEYRKGIEAYKETGVYLIGRIVVFNDPIYAKDHPENCIKYGDDTTWPSAYSRGVWEYNVRLAQEAVKEYGFDEIQFDYVRFPENSFEMSKSGKADFRNVYGEEKGQAVQNFCFYAADQIHEAGAYFSVDVFGESAYGYMTAYGQYWAGISNIVDAISAMPYTDHMGVDGGWEDPYGIMYSWGKKARKQQKKLEHPAVARTWITGYDTPHWDPVYDYGTAELKAQIQGLRDRGLDGGFIPWNAASSIEKYTEYQEVWNTEE